MDACASPPASRVLSTLDLLGRHEIGAVLDRVIACDARYDFDSDDAEAPEPVDSEAEAVARRLEEANSFFPILWRMLGHRPDCRPVLELAALIYLTAHVPPQADRPPPRDLRELGVYGFPGAPTPEYAEVSAEIKLADSLLWRLLVRHRIYERMDADLSGYQRGACEYRDEMAIAARAAVYGDYDRDGFHRDREAQRRHDAELWERSARHVRQRQRHRTHTVSRATPRRTRPASRHVRGSRRTRSTSASRGDPPGDADPDGGRAPSAVRDERRGTPHCVGGGA